MNEAAQYQPSEPTDTDSQFLVAESMAGDRAIATTNSKSEGRRNIVTIDGAPVGLALADALRSWLNAPDVITLRRSLLQILSGLDD